MEVEIRLAKMFGKIAAIICKTAVSYYFDFRDGQGFDFKDFHTARSSTEKALIVKKLFSRMQKCFLLYLSDLRGIMWHYMDQYRLSHLKQLEAESIQIIREAVAETNNPVMLYSIGKDSSVLLKLAEKAFYPGKLPFPLLHIDTGFKFREMIEFRDYYTAKIGAKLIVWKNESEEAMQFDGSMAHTDQYIYHKKTKPLLDALKYHEFDLAFGGARRDEEKSRAKERIFSFRDINNIWDPKNQRPEIWNLYNAHKNKGESIRCFPLSNWTETDVWTYIKEEGIEIVPLYFSQKMKVLRRNGVILRVDEHVSPCEGEEIFEEVCRFRTLGCAPSTGAIISNATDLDEIIKEVVAAKNSERESRAIDHGSESSMEDKKKQGYF